MDTEDRKADIRTEVTGADDTGLVAQQTFLTQAETQLVQPALPLENLHAALPTEHEAHETIDRLHAEMHGEAPDRRSIETHVERLRALPELEAAIANWWDDPQTQRFVANLGQIGL